MYDILIKNGTVIDGTGKQKFLSDVGIQGDTITAVKDLHRAKATREINAAGLFIAPGFIDITNHSDVYWTLFNMPSQESMLSQGITSIIGGVCGSSIAPLMRGDAVASIQKWSDPRDHTINWLRTGELLDTLSHLKMGVNFGTLIGHATLRRGIVGDSFRALTPDELGKMGSALQHGLDAGAFGLSTGLAYSHARHSTFDEIRALAEITKKKGCMYHTHLRDESENLLLSVNEAIRIGKEIGIPVHIAHFKVMGRDNWPLFIKGMDMVEEASQNGIPITFDFYPYTTTATVLYTLLPEWVSEGGKIATLRRLRDMTIRKHVIDDMKWSPSEYGSITIAQSRNSSFTGRTMDEIARHAETCVEEALINMLIASEDRVIAFVDTLSKSNLSRAAHSKISIVSTSAAGYDLAFAKKGKLVHPRSFGTFPKVLSEYVKARDMFSWEDAIAKMTSMPARLLNLRDRGIIDKNAKADIVLFDPNSIRDTATFENPYQFPEGIEYVLVNGKIAMEKGKCLNAESGKVLRHSCV